MKMEFVCKVCDERYPNKSHLINHLMMKHTPQKSVSLPLSNQDKVNTQPNTSVSRNSACICVCDICFKSSTDMNSLSNHILSHVGAMPYFCQSCMFSTISQQMFWQHKFSEVGVKKVFSFHDCELCDGKFSTFNGLVSHYAKHLKVMPFTCKVCSVMFSERKDLAIHNHIHQLTLLCEICQRKFTSHENLLQHVLTHNPEKFFKQIYYYINSNCNNSISKETADNCKVSVRSEQPSETQNSNITDDCISMTVENIAPNLKRAASIRDLPNQACRQEHSLSPRENLIDKHFVSMESAKRGSNLAIVKPILKTAIIKSYDSEETRSSNSTSNVSPSTRPFITFMKPSSYKEDVSNLIDQYKYCSESDSRTLLRPGTSINVSNLADQPNSPSVSNSRTFYNPQTSKDGVSNLANQPEYCLESNSKTLLSTRASKDVSNLAQLPKSPPRNNRRTLLKSRSSQDGISKLADQPKSIPISNSKSPLKTKASKNDVSNLADPQKYLLETNKNSAYKPERNLIVVLDKLPLDAIPADNSGLFDKRILRPRISKKAKCIDAPKSPLDQFKETPDSLIEDSLDPIESCLSIVKNLKQCIVLLERLPNWVCDMRSYNKYVNEGFVTRSDSISSDSEVEVLNSSLFSDNIKNVTTITLSDDEANSQNDFQPKSENTSNLKCVSKSKIQSSITHKLTRRLKKKKQLLIKHFALLNQKLLSSSKAKSRKEMQSLRKKKTATLSDILPRPKGVIKKKMTKVKLQKRRKNLLSETSLHLDVPKDEILNLNNASEKQPYYPHVLDDHNYATPI